MAIRNTSYYNRMLIIVVSGLLLLMWSIISGLSIGSSSEYTKEAILKTLSVLSGYGVTDSVTETIIWQIRLPRVFLAATVGATLSLGGLVFQALLRNPLAEPYILGVSGGSAIGAIIGILMGLSPFPGITITAFFGSMIVLAFIILLASGVTKQTKTHNDSLLLGGVMMNAFCSALIMFLISISQSSQMQNILFWLMGDFSSFARAQIPILLTVVPAYLLIFFLGNPMNLLLTGNESAAALGLNVKTVSLLLLVTTSFMVSVVVSQSGLVGFVGLVIPHILRNIFGPDHRLLIPACILGGSSYMILCDVLARTLSATGEMPVGIITALLGAPLFIFLLWKGKR